MTASVAMAKDGDDALVSEQLSKLASLIERNLDADGTSATAIPRLSLIRSSRPTEPLPGLHEPALCIVAQGREQMMLADELYLYGPGQCLVVSVDLPVVGQVIEATPASPFLCLGLTPDPGQLSALVLETGMGNSHNRQTRPLGPGLSVIPVEPALLDATMRLVRLLESPKDIGRSGMSWLRLNAIWRKASS